MTTPFFCLFGMLTLVVLTKVPVAVAQAKSNKGVYDNRNPRTQQAALVGWGKRALSAHMNTFEAITIFTPAVLISHFAAADAAPTAASLAVTFLVARILYPVAYIADVHILRSAIWGVGYFAALWMALLPAL